MAARLVVLVTGASSGIGRAVAEEAHRRGHDVIATARRMESLREVGCSQRLALDVTDDASVAGAAQAAGDVDVLVNNAGVGAGGPAEHHPLGETKRQMDVNFFGTVRCVQAFLPRMRARGSGVIVNISSMSARIPWLFASSYAASKAAVDAYSEALRWEVRPLGIKVILVEPGKIATPFGARFRVYGGEDAAYEALSSVWGRQFEVPAPGPEHVATAVADVLDAEDPPVRVAVGQDAIDLLGARQQFADAAFEERFAAYFGLAYPSGATEGRP